MSAVPPPPPLRPEDLYRRPNALADHYLRFRVADRLLLTGHSHQAWPDVAFQAQQQAWLDAAERVDEKWEAAFERAQEVRAGYRRLLGDPRGEIALAANTHELLVRFLSALPLGARPRLVTTDGEFHTIRRQLSRLAEEGIEVVRVAAEPGEDLPDRLAGAVDARTGAVLVSTVFYRTGRIVRGLGRLMQACLGHGTELLLDVYHQLNVVPLSLPEEGLEEAYVTGGGYKYCQLGEGNAFLRLPPGREPRPVVTGWFGEPGEPGDPGGVGMGGDDGPVRYGRGAERFSGATYDPVSHYRGAAVLGFFERQGLTPSLLREVSQHQVRLLADAFDAADPDPALVDRDRGVDLGEIGGFLALRSPRAERLRQGLRERGVLVDARGDVLRLGPAPYLSDGQLAEAMEILVECAQALVRE